MTIKVMVINKLDEDDSKKLDEILAAIKQSDEDRKRIDEMAKKLDTTSNQLAEALKKVTP